MDNEEINGLVAQLDASIPKEAAQVDLQYDETANGVQIVANRAGLIRLAVECLRAATTFLRPDEEVLHVDWKYLFVKDSGFVSKVSRTESVLPPEPPPFTAREKVRNLALVVLVFAFLIFLIASTMVGCVTIINKIGSY
ncbi:MAG: hypothetical protein AB7O65_03885 [Candidatus Korobacteraceae bacterium]